MWQVICKYYATLYKGFEHPQILVPWCLRGSWNQAPMDTEEELYNIM